MSLTEHAERPAVRWGASTDIGPVRSENEDSWLAVPPVFAVADGMGGHLGGAQASSSAVITLQEFLSTDRLGNRPVDLVDLSVAIDAAATAVASLAPIDTPASAPGTTLSGVMVLRTAEGPYWLSFNVGDSRVYVVGGGGIRQLTHDHSALQEARDLAATSGAPRVIPPANVVTKALGAGQTGSVKADYTIMRSSVQTACTASCAIRRFTRLSRPATVRRGPRTRSCARRWNRAPGTIRRPL